MHYMIYFLGLPVSKSLYRKTRYVHFILSCPGVQGQGDPVYVVYVKNVSLTKKEKLSCPSYCHFYSLINKVVICSIITTWKL